MSEQPADFTVTAPGVYAMPHAAYLADPVPGGSLSRSEAMRLLPPSCPALFRWEKDHPPPSSDVFDFGHAAHRMVLGAGPQVAVIDAADWRKKDTQAARDAAYAAGRVPLLAADYAVVQAMARAIREHPVAGQLFNAVAGRAEQSLFWGDQQTGVSLRARLDWLPESAGGRMIVPDYKTCRSADLRSVEKALVDYGYCQQAAWYCDGVRELGLADDVAFVLVMQEKSPPYLVTVAQPDSTAMLIGRGLNRKAIDLYAECVESGRWPGYCDDVALVSLPAWAESRLLEEIE